MERTAEMKIRVILDEFKFRRYREISSRHTIVTLEIFVSFSQHFFEKRLHKNRMPFFILNTTNLLAEASRDTVKVDRSPLYEREKLHYPARHLNCCLLQACKPRSLIFHERTSR